LPLGLSDRVEEVRAGAILTVKKYQDSMPLLLTISISFFFSVNRSVKPACAGVGH
jgi:hypothetical protein